MEYIVSFVLAFIIVYMFYFVTVILQSKKHEKFKSSNQVMYFVKKYKLNVNKLNIKKFINIVSLTNSLVISISFTFIIKISSIYLQLLVGLIILIPLMLLSYHFVGNYLKKECK